MINFELAGLKRGLFDVVSKVTARYREKVRAKQEEQDAPKEDNEPKNRAELSLLRAMGKVK
jgi:hypothetical protein